MMIHKLAELVTAQQITTGLVILLLVGYFVYKEWPGFHDRMTSGTLKAHKVKETAETLAHRISGVERELQQVNEKLDSDYRRLDELEKWRKRTQSIVEESAEERELMIRGILGCIDGLQQLGANGDTSQAKKALNDYLYKKAHDIRQ